MMKFDVIAVSAQLERILASPEINSGKRLGQFLRYVTEQVINGQQDNINQYSIGVEALNYPLDFDPQNNPMVRIHASRLRRALTAYYSSQGVDDPIRIDIPRGGYIPVFTLHRGNLQDEISSSEIVYTEAARPKQQAGMHDGPSLGILPLDYLGNEPEYSFFGTGITEEIIIALTRFQEFLIVGPLDRDFICQKHLGPTAIGQKYDVRFLLDGTIRMRGQTLRLTTKLTDTLNGRKLWGQFHDLDINKLSVDQVEHDIVGRIVTTIADNFGVIPRTLGKEILSRHHDNPSDYSAILRFHHHVRVLSEKSLGEAIESLENVVQRNPNHDLALALLGDLISTPYWLGYTDDQYELDRATEIGKRALSLNPNSQPAHFTMAIIYYLRFQKALCLNEIEKALDLNPNNSNILANAALFLMGLGKREDGLVLIHKAMLWNPHHPGWYHIIPFFYHYYRGEFNTAFIDAHAFNTPGYLWDPLIRTAVLGQLGHLEDAKKAGDELLMLVPDFERRARSLIHRMVYSEENTTMLLDGLQKAGLATL